MRKLFEMVNNTLNKTIITSDKKILFDILSFVSGPTIIEVEKDSDIIQFTSCKYNKELCKS